jgi:beta-glucosidase
MSLPNPLPTLISRLTATNPNTTLVLQSGTPVTLSPFLASTPAILQAWYGGNETGNAIADILFGAVNPSAKLSLSWPKRVEDNPAFLNYRTERGKVVYGEGVFVGYRYYEKVGREVDFAFGHGLSYTSFEMEVLKVSNSDDEVAVSVDVSNTGQRDGAQVVQVYVAQEEPSIDRPVKELKGFTKVFLKAGETKKAVEVKISKKYAASWWDEESDAWVMEKGRYEVLVGDSSDHTPLSGEYFEVEETKWWNGL